MTILGQIREEAARTADSMPLQIIEMAQKNLTRTRFTRLRQGKAIPETQTEHDYLYAVKQYVYHKIRVKRMDGQSYASRNGYSYGVHQQEIYRWRQTMDRIEFNLSYELLQGRLKVESDEIAEWSSEDPEAEEILKDLDIPSVLNLESVKPIIGPGGPYFLDYSPELREGVVLKDKHPGINASEIFRSLIGQPGTGKLTNLVKRREEPNEQINANNRIHFYGDAHYGVDAFPRENGGRPRESADGATEGGTAQERREDGDTERARMGWFRERGW